jgi:hypothetical protein
LSKTDLGGLSAVPSFARCIYHNFKMCET